jgi:AcrR family transcriptional regulator
VAQGLRAQGKSNTRAAIVEKSLGLFIARGYDTVTTQEIADAVGITQRTLFRYFPRKDAIVYNSAYDYVARFEMFLTQAMDERDDSFDAVCDAFEQLSRYFNENRRVIAALYAIVETSDQLKAIERAQQTRIDALAAWALEGPDAFRTRQGQPSLQARIAASVVFGVIRPMHRAWLRGELPGDLTVYARLSLSRLRPTYLSIRDYSQAVVAAFAEAVPHDVAPRTRS